MLEHFGSVVQARAQPGAQLGPLGLAVAVAELPPMGAPAAPLSAPPPVAFRQAANNNVGEGTISVKQESNLLEGVCASCGRTILDRYVMRVNERDYHEACLSCCECSQPLSRSCYTRDCKFYCWADYERVYGTKCARCQLRIDCNEMVMRTPAQAPPATQLLHPQQQALGPLGAGPRAEGPVFHVDCFVCCVCGEPLRRGALYKLKHGQPLCKREFQSDMYNVNSPQDDDLMDDNRPRDGRRGPKRPRTILTSVQRRQFKASFEISPKPCRKVREALAKDTGLSVRVVQVWFQNQRAKMKKLQRKAKTESGSDKEPKEDRKPDSPHRDHTHVYLDALNMRDEESSNFPSATQPLNPNNPYSLDDAYPGHSGESSCSSDSSIDGTEAGFELGEADAGSVSGATGASAGQDVLGAGSHSQQQQHLHPHHPHQSQQQQQPPNDALGQLHSHAAMHNPIDKLYLMQNSYFSVDHP